MSTIDVNQINFTPAAGQALVALIGAKGVPTFATLDPGFTLDTTTTPLPTLRLPAVIPPPTIPSFADAEIPAGAIGNNPTFTLANAPNPAASLILVRNGEVQEQGATGDYTLAGTTITFSVASEPETGDSLMAWYRH